MHKPVLESDTKRPADGRGSVGRALLNVLGCPGAAGVKLYTYLGDRLTDPALRGKLCRAVLKRERDDNCKPSEGAQCVRGRGSMLVLFHDEREPRVVIARLLRKVTV